MAGRRPLDVYRSQGPPAADLAREAWLLDRAAAGEISLFLTSWEGPAVILGYGQDADSVDVGWCEDHGVPVLRRLTGGTGVIHAGDLGVGLSLPIEHPWAGGIIELYGRFLDVLEPALKSVGAEVTRLAEPQRASRVRSPICFLDQLADTLVVDGKKVVGCAQTRRRGAVLIHAAVLLGLNASRYSSVFGVSTEDVAKGLAPAVPGGDWRTVGEAIADHMAAALGLEVRRRELESVPERFLEPYRTKKWAPLNQF